MCDSIYEIFFLVDSFHLLMDDFVHQTFYSLVCPHQLAQMGKANTVTTVTHLVFQSCQIVCQAIGSSGKLYSTCFRWLLFCLGQYRF